MSRYSIAHGCKERFIPAPEVQSFDPNNAASLDLLATPVWVFELDRHRIWWANQAALDFWKAASIDALRARDFSTDSDTVRKRLRQMAQDTGATDGFIENWTLYPAGNPVAVTARFRPIVVADGCDALLIEMTKGHDTDPNIKASRIAEAVRYSGAMLSMFTFEGTLLVQNTATFARYGSEQGRGLRARLVETDVMVKLIETVTRMDVFDAEVEVHTSDGPRFHHIKAHKGRDPSTGAPVIVLSEYDVSDVIRLREELSEMNANLERHVLERNKSLKLSEERFSLAMQGANDGLSDRNFDTGEMYLSPRWLEMLGYTASDPTPGLDMILARIHPDDKAAVEASLIRPDPKDTTPSAEFRVRHQDGHWVDILSRAFLVVRDNKVVRIVGTHVDISERKRSERALRRLREILFEGSEALPIGVAYYDDTGTLVMSNHLYPTMLPESTDILVPGVSFQTVLRRSADHLAAQFGHSNPEDYIRERLNATRIKATKWVQEQSNGRTLIATEIPTSGKGFVSLIEDITEERLRQKQLQQAQKMEAIGQLTGGVAHDFNNLLAVIMGNLELLQGEIETGVPHIEEANTLIYAAIDAVKHGADLTGAMLAYARKARLAPTVIDLNKTIRETERWMRRTIPSNIDIETVLQPDIWPIRVDDSSLQSALVNLILNARDAIDGSGKLTIETANLRIDETNLESHAETIPQGFYVMVAVTDTGTGIEPELLDQIYDPFFTTKSLAEGTGLGLSMVEGFVKQSGGTIRVSSELGAGTSFRLYFSATTSDGTAMLRAPDPPKQPKADTDTDTRARILLAEDKPEVMVVLERILVAAGYHVTPAASGDTAFAKFRLDPRFDLILTDIIMPGRLQGPEFAAECRNIRPGIPVIFLSGYASEETGHDDEVRSGDVRLMKPVSRKALLHAVKTGLRQSRQDTADPC